MPEASVEQAREESIQRAVESAIRIGLIALLVFWVYDIVAPFVSPLVWGAIIAIAGNGAYRWLLDRLGGRKKVAATVFTITALLILITPTVWLADALVESGQDIAKQLAGGVHVPPPPEAVRDWPVIGGSVHEFWSLASSNLTAAISRADDQLKALGVWLLKTAAGLGFAVLQFALSIVIAGLLLANSEGAARLTETLSLRLAPETGRRFGTLAEQTVRGVASGVVGVAIIQCILAGIGFFVAGVPGAAVIALVCLLFGVVQLPLSIPIVPVIIYVWTQDSTLTAVLFTIWSLPVSMLDNVLKPILMGRGVEAPMLVVFVGAIGGFATGGIVGLFVGAVVLVVAYELFRAWLGIGD